MRLQQGFIRYVQEENAVARLCEDLFGLDTIYCIGGRTSLAATQNLLRIKDASIHFRPLDCKATVWAQARMLAQEIIDLDAQAVIGVGGGVMMDVAKAAATLSGRALYLLPTSAATCSAATTLIALYDEKGRRTGSYVMPRPIDGVYVDESILRNAPKRLLCSGIADSIAKLSEAASACLYPDNPPEMQWRSMMAQAMHLMDIYFTQASAALDGDPAAFSEILYANLYLTAQITATGSKRHIGEIAHHFYNGVTCVFPEERFSFLHGEIVGVGVLLEMGLTGAVAGYTARSIQTFLRDVLYCPTSLKELGLPTDEVPMARLSAYISEKSGLSPTMMISELSTLIDNK